MHYLAEIIVLWESRLFLSLKLDCINRPSYKILQFINNYVFKLQNGKTNFIFRVWGPHCLWAPALRVRHLRHCFYHKLMPSCAPRCLILKFCPKKTCTQQNNLCKCLRALFSKTGLWGGYGGLISDSGLEVQIITYASEHFKIRIKKFSSGVEHSNERGCYKTHFIHAVQPQPLYWINLVLKDACQKYVPVLLLFIL